MTANNRPQLKKHQRHPRRQRIAAPETIRRQKPRWQQPPGDSQGGNKIAGDGNKQQPRGQQNRCGSARGSKWHAKAKVTAKVASKRRDSHAWWRNSCNRQSGSEQQVPANVVARCRPSSHPPGAATLAVVANSLPRLTLTADCCCLGCQRLFAAAFVFALRLLPLWLSLAACCFRHCPSLSLLWLRPFLADLPPAFDYLHHPLRYAVLSRAVCCHLGFRW